MDFSSPISIVLAFCVLALEVLYIRRRIRQRITKQHRRKTVAESNMGFLHRLTLFKVPERENQQKLIDAFGVMGQNQIKVCSTLLSFGVPSLPRYSTEREALPCHVRLSASLPDTSPRLADHE